MNVYVTGYGLRPFRIKEEYQLDNNSPKQYKGEYKLPKGITRDNGSQWMELDYWFTKEQIFN